MVALLIAHFETRTGQLDRPERLAEARKVVWEYFVQRELAGFRKHTVRKGQTLGKTWVHIKVVREADGNVPGVWLALGRDLLQSLLTPVTLYLNLLWPLWDSKNQTLHDKVCSTVVIRVPQGAA